MPATIALLAALTLVGCAADPDEPSPPPSPSAASYAERSDALLSDLLSPDEPGCSAAVGQRGEIAWAGALGAADTATGAELDTQSSFDLASVSKQFTASLVLLLDEDGVLALSDPLSSHAAGLPAWAAEVTLADLMHHTSGISDYTFLLTESGTGLADPADQADALAAIAASELEFEPGSQFAYSNSNYVLLAEVIAQVTGQPFPDLAQERLFEPLGLNITIDPAFASEHLAQPEGDAAARSAWSQLGDGSAFTTPSELARWGDVFRTGAIGGPGFLESVTAGAVETGAGSRYGAGLEVSETGALSHLGGWAGYVSAFGVSADREITIAVACNASDAPVGDVASGLREIWAP